MSAGQIIAGRRPLSVTLVGWLYVVVGAAGFIYHGSEIRTGPPLDWDTLLVELVEILALVSGVFLLRAQNRARWLALAWMGFHVILSVFHSLSELLIHAVFFTLIAWALLRREAGQYFTAREPNVQLATDKLG